jgi:malonyl CoA-acyl carrier protein transacylase
MWIYHDIPSTSTKTLKNEAQELLSIANLCPVLVIASVVLVQALASRLWDGHAC